MHSVIRYSAEHKILWNSFLDNAKNGTFMLSRNFMEYHAERFEDYSLMVFDNEKVAAIFPANKKDNTLYAHSGLTYGSIVLSKTETTKNVIRYIASILAFCQSQGIDKIIFKQIPSFYSTVTHDEVEYILFLANARLIRMDIAFAIDNRIEKIEYQQRRTRAIKKATKNNVVVKESTDFTSFWTKILEPNLKERFGVNPVHSLKEIESLSKNNPGHIRQFEAWKNEDLLAGCTIFETTTTAHAQYISASDEGRNSGAIDLLFHKLISETFSHKNFFDFGIVNEQDGRKINSGLLDWKEGFGAKAFAHRFYEIETSQHCFIEEALNKES